MDELLASKIDLWPLIKHYAQMYHEQQQHHGAWELDRLEQGRKDLDSAIERQLRALETGEKHLGELLAVIHGDGGQYQAQHGTKKAVLDAFAKWANLIRTSQRRAAETTRELSATESASFDKTVARSPRRIYSVLDVKVTVCSECLCASCWQGIFYCEKSKEASTTQKTVGQLRALGPLESPEHWFRSPHTGVISEADLSAYQSAVKAPSTQESQS